MCGSGKEDSETRQRAHPASWTGWSAGANLTIDRRPLAYRHIRDLDANVTHTLKKSDAPDQGGKIRKRSEWPENRGSSGEAEP